MKSQKLKKTQLPHDGERMIPQFDRGTSAYADHIIRYESVIPLVEGKIVLDIACGSGYGSKSLAKKAKKVYGVDIDKGAVKYADENYNASNVEYKVGSATQIPLNDNSVDVVVSFETIEHIENSKKFLTEVKRILKPGGVLALSTPNDLEFPEGNHFHVHEYKQNELNQLLKKFFGYMDSYSQSTWIYTSLGKKEMATKEWDEKIRIINAAPIKSEQSLFFLLVCSDKPLQQTLPPIGATAEHWSVRNTQEKERLTQQHIDNITNMLKSTQDYSKELVKQLEIQDQLIKTLKTRLDKIMGLLPMKVIRKIRNLSRKS